MSNPNIPQSGFVLHITRLRVESKGNGNSKRYRTVGRYECYFNGSLIDDPNLKGATAEPRGPGDNSSTGKKYARRIKAGQYPLGTHGFGGSKYHSFDYHRSKRPFPGIYVHDTDERSAILIHRGVGFKASVGCINLTGSIVGPDDPIGPNTSYARMKSFIDEMQARLTDFPVDPGERIPDAWLVIDGEP